MSSAPLVKDESWVGAVGGYNPRANLGPWDYVGSTLSMLMVIACANLGSGLQKGAKQAQEHNIGQMLLFIKHREACENVH